jgi:transcriptional regulator with XRE-family HTH domain
MTRLRDLRMERGWTAFELSRRSRVNPSDLSALELGRKIPPADSVLLRRLARVLKYEGEPAELLEDVDNGQSA